MRGAALALYRVRGPLSYLAVLILVANAIAGDRISHPGVRGVLTILAWCALGLAGLCLVLTILMPRWLPVQRARVVEAPVRGRWQALNSPASKVPSHGVRGYGQAYAIDLVYEPPDEQRPRFGGPMMRSPREYPGFGQPVFAMVDGTVVHASDWRRDHRARSNWWGLLYLMVEGMVREMGGPGFVVGNHVIIRSDDGTYAAVAHLQRRSVTVKVGDRLTAGTRIGRCGNSGNTTEPHVHAQLMDRASFWTAQGVPMAFARITLGDEPDVVDALPANEQHMTASEVPPSRRREQGGAGPQHLPPPR